MSASPLVTLSGHARLAGILGWPVAHSRSPRLHGLWLRRHGVDGAYLPLPVAPDRFAAAVRDLVLERAATESGRGVTPCALGALGPGHDLCPVGCCPARAPRPAAAGADSPYA